MTAGKLLHTLDEATGPILSVSFNPSEFILGTCSQDGFIRSYDLQNFNLISDYSEAYAKQITFTPNGEELLAACQDSFQVFPTNQNSLNLDFILGTN